MEWKGLAARFCRSFHICCALTGAWNGRRVNCPGLLLGPASVGKGLGASCQLPCQRVGVLRGGAGGQNESGRWPAIRMGYGGRSADDFRDRSIHSAAAPTAWACSGILIEARSVPTNAAVT
jgi:hypothetical protein